MNRLQLVGKLVWPVEVEREPVTGLSVAKAMVAVSNDDDVTGIDFIPVTLRDNEAIDASNYLGDGSLIAIDGRVHSKLVTDRYARGVRRTRRVLSVTVDRVTYLVVRQPGSGARP
jgi:single-stranded DNA-binding protein